MAIDLERFCFCGSRPERPELSQPFSIGEWTYATNGHVMVRVPRRADIPENPAAPAKVTTLFEESAPRARYKPAPTFELSEPYEWEETIPCLQCEGMGRKHQCPDCECECAACDGTGLMTFIRWHETVVGRACFNSKYIAWLQALPNLALGHPVKRAPSPLS